jgi:hypothetical protein
MANKVEILVVAKDMTGTTFDDVERKAKEAGGKAGDEAGKALNENFEKSVDTEGVGEKIGEDLGTDIKEGIDKGLGDGGGLGKSLENSMGTLKDSVGKGLADIEGEFENHGKSSGDKFSTGFSAAISAGLKGAASLFSDFANVAVELGQGVADAIVPALVAGAVAASPLIAGVLAGALTGSAIIIAAISGTILAALADPSIITEAKALGTNILDALKIDATPFIQPVHDAIGTLQSDFRELEPVIQSIFANSAQFVQPLIDILADLGSKLTEGLDAVISGAGPEFMEVFGKSMSDLGDSLENLFLVIGENGTAAATAFGAAIELIGAAVDALSIGLDILLPIWQKWNDLIAAVTNNDDATGKFVLIGDALGGVAAAADGAVTAIGNLISAQLALTDPVLQYSNALIDVQKKQDAYTAAVSKFGEGSTQANNAAIQLGNAVLQAGDAAAKTGDDLSNGLTPAMKATMEAMGVSKPVIDAVDQAFKNTTASANSVPAKVQTNLTQEGAEGVISKFDEVKSAVDAIPSSKTVTINVVETGAGVAALRASGGVVGKAATGGVRGNMVLVGEQGPELVSLPYGSAVHTAGQTNRMMAKSSTPAMDGGGSMDYQEMLAELREIRRALASGGNVYLDNRLLGSIQGRQADLYERAG